jgi:hypothetical protein
MPAGDRAFYAEKECGLFPCLETLTVQSQTRKYPVLIRSKILINPTPSTLKDDH